MMDFILSKYDSSGNLIWARCEGAAHSDICPSVAVDNNGNLYIAGSFGSHVLHLGNFTLTNSSTGFSTDFFVAKLGSTPNIHQENNPAEADEMNVFPNPSDGNLKITSTEAIKGIEIRNVLGQIIYNEKPKERNVSLKINVDGMYFVTIKSNKQITTRKLVVQ